jgi:hypothetical protein
MTMRPCAERLLANSPLALDMLMTIIRRVGREESKLLYSDEGRSGPTRLNLDSLPSNEPWPMKNTKTTLFVWSSDLSPAKVRLTSSAVERALPPGESVVAAACALVAAVRTAVLAMPASACPSVPQAAALSAAGPLHYEAPVSSESSVVVVAVAVAVAGVVSASGNASGLWWRIARLAAGST